jgi:hypothetical protein
MELSNAITPPYIPKNHLLKPIKQPTLPPCPFIHILDLIDPNQPCL